MNVNPTITSNFSAELYQNKLVDQARDNLNSMQMDNPKAREAAKEFESMFLAQMMGHMFSGLETDGYFGGGNAEQIYRSMMTNEYAKMVTEKGGVGIADSVYQEILKLQEAGS